MRVFAIRHKATGLFMPSRMFRTNTRGWSTWEPGDKAYGGYNKTPRLFDSWVGALRAIIAWAAGPWIAPLATEGDWETGCYDYQDIPCPKGKSSRNKNELEIVELNLTEL